MRVFNWLSRFGWPIDDYLSLMLFEGCHVWIGDRMHYSWKGWNQEGCFRNKDNQCFLPHQIRYLWVGFRAIDDIIITQRGKQESLENNSDLKINQLTSNGVENYNESEENCLYIVVPKQLPSCDQMSEWIDDKNGKLFSPGKSTNRELKINIKHNYAENLWKS